MHAGQPNGRSATRHPPRGRRAPQTTRPPGASSASACTRFPRGDTTGVYSMGMTYAASASSMTCSAIAAARGSKARSRSASSIIASRFPGTTSPPCFGAGTALIPDRREPQQETVWEHVVVLRSGDVDQGGTPAGDILALIEEA